MSRKFCWLDITKHYRGRMDANIVCNFMKFISEPLLDYQQR